MANEPKQTVDLPELNNGQRQAQLQLRTYKSARGILSAAHVHFVKDGFVTFELFGDFSKTLGCFPDRATQKNLDARHAETFTPAQLEILKGQILAFYADKAKRSRAA